MAYETAAAIINDVLAELALGDEVADPYASTDATVVRLRALLKTAGRSLVREFPWSHLQTEHTLSTIAAQTEYELPSDFARVLDGTAWDRSADFPLSGPLGAGWWQALQALPVVGAITYYWRVKGTKVLLHPAPTAAVTLALEYLSAWWVQPAASATRTTDAPTAGTDILHFDPHLLTRKLKLMWLEEAGFPSEAARAEYELALSQAHGADGAAPVLHLGRSSPSVGRLLDECNLPETGFGG